MRLRSFYLLCLAASCLGASAAPVDVYEKDECLLLVAKRSDADTISIQSAAPLVAANYWKQRDRTGFWLRFPGVLLSWVLVSLGTPFWFDLLKRLVGFRSLLAKKDEDDRRQREQQVPPVGGAPAPTAAAAAAGAGVVASGEDERGDLAATGAAG